MVIFAAVLKVVLEVLVAFGPILNFFFGFGMMHVWVAVQGAQFFVHYPMLKVDAPGNLGIFQAAMRKVATWEIVDGDLL
jgi:hypothetical protein